MFEKLKQLFSTKQIEESKEIIICIHGFGKRVSHEYDNFMLWNNEKLPMVSFDIFQVEDEKDCVPATWIKRCEDKVASYINEGYKVTLVGFSMGGVLASHCASIYSIERLFLMAPAFDYLHVGNLMNTAISLLKKEEKKQPSMSAEFTQCFMEVVKLCKEDIAHVTCPVCFVHGDKDEVIPLRSSYHAYDKLPHEQKQMFIIHNGKHSILRRKETAWEVYQLLLLFINKTILGDTPITFAKDIFDDIEEDIEKDS